MPISLSASICCYRFFNQVAYTYTVVALEKLGLHFLRKRRYYPDALFFIQVYRGFKSCTSFLENVSLRVPPSNLREFLLFCACPSNKHCPSARCASAANVAVDKELDIIALGADSLNYIFLLIVERIELLLFLVLLLLLLSFPEL
jgi:hypothetical protein